MNQYKTCHACKQEKPFSEFYTLRGKYQQSECKECMKLRSKRQLRVDRKISTVETETAVINELAKLGIPSLPGKALRHQHMDVIAWGSVGIEVKSSALSNRKFTFGFTPGQRNGKLRGDLVVFVCRHDDYNTFHVFPAKHPMFFHPNGKMKIGVCYTPNRSGQGRPSPLTDDMMMFAQNAWHLIEQKRLEVSAELKRKAALIETIAA